MIKLACKFYVSAARLFLGRNGVKSEPAKSNFWVKRDRNLPHTIAILRPKVVASTFMKGSQGDQSLLEANT